MGNKNPKDIDFSALLVHFNALQAQHEAMRLNESEKDVIGSSSADRFLDNLEGSDEPLRLSMELDDTVNNFIDESAWYVFMWNHVVNHNFHKNDLAWIIFSIN